MPQPDSAALLTEVPLRVASVKYQNQGYIANEILPIIDTNNPKVKLARYVKGGWFRDEADVRGPGSRSKRGGYVVDTVSFATKQYGFAKEVHDEDVQFASANSGLPLDPYMDAVEFCADKIDLKKERRVAAALIAANFSGAGAGGEDAAGLWAPNDATNTFLEDVFTRIETIRSATGLRPNTLMVSANTWAKLVQVDAILNRIRYVAMGVLDTENLAKIFGIDRVLIGGAVYSSANEAKAGTDFTAVNVWENTATKGAAFLFYKHPTVGLKVPLVGAQLRLFDGEPEFASPSDTVPMNARKQFRYREDAEHQTVIEVLEDTDFQITGTDLGFWWKDTILT